MRRRKWILTFLATALAGLAVRQLIAFGTFFKGLLFHLPGYDDAGGSLSQSALQEQILADWWLTVWGPPLATVLVAAVAGYVSPRRFWLWGLAAVCLRPVEVVLLEILPLFYLGFQGVVGPPHYALLLLFETVTFLMLAVTCVVSASAGAGLKLLVRRPSGRSRAPLEGEEPGAPEEGGGTAERFGWFSWRAVAVGAVVAVLVSEFLWIIATGLLFGRYPWTLMDPEAIRPALENPTIRIIEGGVSVLIAFGAPLLGGYLAGRRAGRRGGSHGLIAAGRYLLLGAVVGMAWGIAAGLAIRTGLARRAESSLRRR